MDANNIVITEKDLLRLKNVIRGKDGDEIESLEVELDRARVVCSDEIPSGVVTMNSQVEYLDQKSNVTKIITIVFPEDANSVEGKISILAPIGSALIGLREGQEISWKIPTGETKTFKIIKIHYQPEESGDFHL